MRSVFSFHLFTSKRASESYDVYGETQQNVRKIERFGLNTAAKLGMSALSPLRNGLEPRFDHATRIVANSCSLTFEAKKFRINGSI